MKAASVHPIALTTLKTIFTCPNLYPITSTAVKNKNKVIIERAMTV